jgi:hypothetical protein
MISKTAIIHRFISKIKFNAVIILGTLAVIMAIWHYYQKSIEDLDERLKEHGTQTNSLKD